MDKRSKKILEIVALVLITFTIGFLCTNNPLSKVQPGNDQAVFEYIAQRMNYGEVPYKYWFDHKGPLLYIIDWIGQNISFSIINGIWLLNLLAIFITIFFTQKILKKVCKLNTIESTIKYMYQIPIYHVDDNVLKQTFEDVQNNKPKYIMIIKSKSDKNIKELVLNGVGEHYQMEKDINKYEVYKYKE